MPEQPWLETALEIQKVLSVKEGQLCLGGEAIPDNQLEQLQQEISLIERMTVWPILIETVRAKAISTGINESTCFENVLTAKALLFLLDWQREWPKAIKQANLKNKVV